MIMSSPDHSRLLPLVTAAISKGGSPILDTLDEMLAEATTVAPEEVPADLVTMDSEVVIETPESNATRRVKLVYSTPSSNDDSNVVSVFSPLGVALLGAQVGATVPLGRSGKGRLLRISAIPYQPESAGDWKL
ncbi:MAG: GreA/GreB family elongation factor [Polyangiaceae bacterium]|nr:GreA/GreB family elongation factor [Polyangiaceae bacterium]